MADEITVSVSEEDDSITVSVTETPDEITVTVDESAATAVRDVELAPFEASEDLSSGRWVQIWNDGGTPKIRKAEPASSRPADGVILESVTTGNAVMVYRTAKITGLSGKTPGAMQYLGTAGTMTETAPDFDSGGVLQILGLANSATSVSGQAQAPVYL